MNRSPASSAPPPLPDRPRPPPTSTPRRRPLSSSSSYARPVPSPSSSSQPPPHQQKQQQQQQQQQQQPFISLEPTSQTKSWKDEDLSPLSWQSCFDDAIDVPLSSGIWRVYTAGFNNHIQLQSHPPPLILVLFHGAGHSALVWGAVTNVLKKKVPVLAFDARGHGATKQNNQKNNNKNNETDKFNNENNDDVNDDIKLDTQTQVSDAHDLLISFCKKCWPDSLTSSSSSSSSSSFCNTATSTFMPSFVLCGHSMGGAIASHLASLSTSKLKISGLIVVDVVEGTALAALPHMPTFLSERTRSFSSIERAIRYVVRSGYVRNILSARTSVPCQLRFDTTRKCWVWRTDLEETQPFWFGWFQHLSDIFLSVSAPKLLILANVNRLDKTLMIAQMQGKFQNILITSAGHAIHEDQPEQTASAILDFLHRNLLLSRSNVNNHDDGIEDEDESGIDSPSVFQQRRPIPSCR